jgi:HD superfamily phosphodiesterase
MTIRTKKYPLITTAERAHLDALTATRRAIRAGDLVKAERWMKLAERYSRSSVEIYRQHDERVAERVVQREKARNQQRWLAAQTPKTDAGHA